MNLSKGWNTRMKRWQITVKEWVVSLNLTLHLLHLIISFRLMFKMSNTLWTVILKIHLITPLVSRIWKNMKPIVRLGTMLKTWKSSIRIKQMKKVMISFLRVILSLKIILKNSIINWINKNKGSINLPKKQNKLSIIIYNSMSN